MIAWNSRNLKQRILNRIIQTQEDGKGIHAYELANELKVHKSHVVRMVARLRDEGHPIINEWLSGPYLYGSVIENRRSKHWQLSRFDLAITILNRTRRALKLVLTNNGPYLEAFFSQLDSMVKILEHERNELQKAQ